MLRKKWNAFDIKFFMAMLMVLDHLHHIPGLLPTGMYALFHVLTRCVGAWFAYLAVEGLYYTKSRLRYNLRLFLWAGIMAAGNQVYNRLGEEKGLHIGNNIFFTLAVGVLCMNVLSSAKRAQTLALKVLGWAGVAALAFFGMLFAEGGFVLLPFMIITDCCRERITLRNLLYAVLSIVMLANAWHGYQTIEETLRMLAFNSDFLFITVMPFLAAYNGERGQKNCFTKYFFYVFYPVHLWVIGAIALAVS